MIESNFGSQTAAAQRQAQSQDVRTQQVQQEANEQAVEEQASSQPLASSGAETANNSVASQPSSVVTRSGETPEEVPLYDSGRPNGSIIRPAIELAQNAEQARQASEQNEQAVTQRNQDEEAVVERNAEQQAERQANDGGSPARGNDPTPDDVQDLV